MPTTRPASIRRPSPPRKRYTTLHPGTKDAALAHHIIASAQLRRHQDPERDQTATRKALAELKMLVQRYPDSPYTKQAGNRIRIAEDMLAASEMNVGRYYLKRKNYVGRHQPLQGGGEPNTRRRAHVEEALYRLVETNMALGIVPEAQAAAAVLGHNFPNSQWYKHAYALLKSGGVSPQINRRHLVQQDAEGADARRRKQNRSRAAPAAKPPPGLPSPEDMPAPTQCPATCRRPARQAKPAARLRAKQRLAGGRSVT